MKGIDPGGESLQVELISHGHRNYPGDRYLHAMIHAEDKTCRMEWFRVEHKINLVLKEYDIGYSGNG